MTVHANNLILRNDIGLVRAKLNPYLAQPRLIALHLTAQIY
jgi:hypothetical protein